MKWYVTYRGKIKLHATTTFKYILAMYSCIHSATNKLISVLYVNIYGTICSNIPDITQFKIKISLRSKNFFKQKNCTTLHSGSHTTRQSHSHISIVTMKSFLKMFSCEIFIGVNQWIHTDCYGAEGALRFSSSLFRSAKNPPCSMPGRDSNPASTLWKEAALTHVRPYPPLSYTLKWVKHTI